jgi:hypothetical protein
MNQFILVNDPTDNKQKEIPVNEDGTVSLITLEHYFPTAYGLEYKNPDTGAERLVKYVIFLYYLFDKSITLNCNFT